MDKIKPMSNKVSPYNGVPVVDSIGDVRDPSAGNMVVLKAGGKLTLMLHDGSQFNPIEGGNTTPTPVQPAIWVLKGNTAATAVTASTPTTFTADISKFNSVESGFTGDITVNSDNELKFTAAQSFPYQVEVHGVIEDAANASQKVMVSLVDEGASENMTGSLQMLAPAATWGGSSEYSFNCVGFARLTPSAPVLLQVMSDADADLVLKQCIVILRRIGV